MKQKACSFRSSASYLCTRQCMYVCTAGSTMCRLSIRACSSIICMVSLIGLHDFWSNTINPWPYILAHHVSYFFFFGHLPGITGQGLEQVLSGMLQACDEEQSSTVRQSEASASGSGCERSETIHVSVEIPAIPPMLEDIVESATPPALTPVNLVRCLRILKYITPSTVQKT